MLRTSAFSITLAALLASSASPVLAQVGAPSAPPAAAPAADPSTSAMVNLVRLLVQQGTITRENGDALLRQAQAEAGQARVAAGELTPPAPGAVRVPYVPQSVRNAIRDEIKAEVMKQASDEGWAAPNQKAPGWVEKVRLNADFRFRGQRDLFAKSNATDIFDYNAINNTAGGFDFFRNINSAPFVNRTVDRDRLRIRARLGAEFDVGPFAMVAAKLATGDDNSPISTNQSLGGGLAKRNIWLDQAYVRLTPHKNVTATLGRFPNPFASSDLVFDRDLNFDGGVIDLHTAFDGGTSVALRGGAFPLDFGSDNYPSTDQVKQKYPSKWLFGGQAEARSEIAGVKLSAAAAFYHFRNIQGQLSAPCLFNGQTIGIGGNDPTECSSDGSRAFFPRYGNTLFFVRDIIVPPGDTQPASNRQYLGLSYKYSLIDLNASAGFRIGGVDALLQGNYVRNLAYKKSDACRYGSSPNGVPFTNVTGTPIPGTNPPQINFNPCSAANPATIDGGNQGFLARLTIGNAKPRKRGEWNLSGDYRYLETDAVLDSLTESDFHLGGTNAKGYSIAGSLGLMDGVWLTGRWFSANEITGRPIAIDTFQIDLNGEF